MTDAENLLIEAGRALYGERWQSDLARALNVSDRTVRRWASGEERPRPGVYVDLMRLCSEHAQALDGLVERLKAQGA